MPELTLKNKTMQYACRKTLADSRPRVRGRFAKNDDFGETPRPASSNHEEEDDEEVGFCHTPSNIEQFNTLQVNF